MSIEHYTNDSANPEYLRACLEDESPMDRHCACGRLIFTLGLACEACEPESLPFLLQEQAA